MSCIEMYLFASMSPEPTHCTGKRATPNSVQIKVELVILIIISHTPKLFVTKNRQGNLQARPLILMRVSFRLCTMATVEFVF